MWSVQGGLSRSQRDSDVRVKTRSEPLKTSERMSDEGAQTSFQWPVAQSYQSDGRGNVQQTGLAHAEQCAQSIVEGAFAKTLPAYNFEASQRQASNRARFHPHHHSSY